MKKIAVILFAMVILFCGCEAGITPTQSESSKDGDVIYENGEYFLRVYNGLRLGNFSPRESNGSLYESVEEIKDVIKTNSFSSEAIGTMYNTFNCVKGDEELLPIIDPDKIIIPVFDGKCDYFRLGFVNRRFICDLYTTFNGKDYRLNFDTYYLDLNVPNYLKQDFEMDLDEADYEERLEYDEDKIKKQKLVYSNRVEIQYEIEAENISYYVVEQYREGKLKAVEFWGEVENVGSFRLYFIEKNDSSIEKEALQWVMQSIELKKG